MNRPLPLAALILIAATPGCRSTPTAVGGNAPIVEKQALAAGAEAYNVLLITLDTTRADHLGAYGAREALTPALDELAARGTVFEQAFTSSPQTLPSHGTILTGLQPPEHGLRSNGRERLPENVPTLASILGKRGYRTAAFTAAFVLDSKFGLDRGFDTYDDDLSRALPQDVPEALSVSRPADVVVDAALAWLDGPAKDPPAGTAAQPFFAWVHLYDPHYPYHSHPQLAETRYAGVASYDGDIAFMDQQIGRLLAFLDQRGLRERTLVIAVADHGEGLEDHREVEHGYLLNEEVLHVPFIVALSGVVRAGHRVPAMVSTVDLFPTVLDIAGLPAEPHAQGRSLVAALRGETIESWPSYGETDLPLSVFSWNPLRSITTPEWKYVRTTRLELYDRGNDRAELYNLASARPEQARRLETQLAGLESRMRPAAAAAPAVELSAADKDRLVALGYAAEHQAPDTQGAGATPVGLKDIKDMLGVKALQVVLIRGLANGTLSLDERLEISRKLVEASPETATFHLDLGDALFAAGKPAEAADAYQAALERRGDLTDATLGMARALTAQGKATEARKHVFEVLRHEPDSAAAHFLAANILAEVGELDTALGHYAEAVRLQPSDADAYYNMANTLARLNQRDRAIDKYEAALRLRPGFAAAHFNLATLLSARGSLDLAAAHYGEVLRLAPGTVDAGNYLGLILESQGKTGEAEARFAETVSGAPKFAAAHSNLARMLALRGDAGAALEHYEEAHRLEPNEASFVAAWALLLATTEDPMRRDTQRAVSLAETAVELTAHRDPRSLQILAVAYEAAARPEDSARASQMALALTRAERG